MALNLIDENFCDLLERLPPDGQEHYTNELRGYIDKLAGGKRRDLADMGIAEAKKKKPNRVRLARQTAMALDATKWQMCKFLRYSTPTRISEAEPYLRDVIAHWKKAHGEDSIDMTPELYLAAVLAKQHGKEDEALNTLEHAMNGNGAGPNTFIWAQASVAHAMRRVGRVEKAEELEKNCVKWFKFHPFGMPPSVFAGFVSDPENPDDPNPILEDPAVRDVIANAVEIPGGMGMFGGGAIVINFG